MRLGLSFRGSRVLAVRGRKSGRWRTTPVNPLSLGGERYLVAPRGETHWVRNLRAGGEAKLRLARAEERIRAIELDDAAKVPILRAYLQRWRSEAGRFFAVGKDPRDDELAAIAPHHPVFRILAD